MEFLILIVIAVGAFFFGSSVGRDVGRKEVLSDIRRRIANGVEQPSEFSLETGLRGDLIFIDYFGASVHGIGFAEGSPGPYLFVNHQDLKEKLKI